MLVGQTDSRLHSGTLRLAIDCSPAAHALRPVRSSRTVCLSAVPSHPFHSNSGCDRLRAQKMALLRSRTAMSAIGTLMPV